MLSIDPKELSIRDRHHHLLNGIGPRPIAWVSTISKNGQVNLAPFSFFNLFSSNPPILAFSPARRGRDGTIKHTLENVKETLECVVNIVNYPLMNQMVLTSLDYPRDTSELEMAGLTAIESELVSPVRIAESPMQLECKVIEIKELGTEGAAGNMVLAEIVRIHLREDALGENGFIDQQKIDLIGRLGEAWYSRAHGDSIFQINSDVTKIGIGYPSLPPEVKTSRVLTGNELAQLATSTEFPNETAVNDFKLSELSDIFMDHQDDPDELLQHLHQLAASHLRHGDLHSAWLTVLAYNS